MAMNGINYLKWKRVILISQLVTAGQILAAEIYGNFMLYVTRSQGYGPDTIVQKLLRYLVLTTAVNFGLILASHIIVRHTKSPVCQKYVLIIATVLLCTDVAASHYQFTIAYGAFIIPVLLSVLYEDDRLCNWAVGLSALGLAVSVFARAVDPLYNQDIAIEGAAAFIFLFSVFLLSKICLETMLSHREELDTTMLGAERAKYFEKVEHMSLQTVETLANAIDAKDRYTKGHSFRVAEYSAIIARELGWTKEEVDTLRYEALLHDIGKIGIPDSVLNKDGKLTNVEFNVVRSHTTIGADILKDITSLPGARDVAKCHHERYDGNGYPTNLAGEEIPVNARIVGLADAYDAMNSDRVYRRALTPEVIRRELVKGRGTQFDPAFLDVFLKVWDEGRLKIRSPFEGRDMQERGLPEEFIDDLKSYISEVKANGNYQGALTVDYGEFSKIYSYLKKLGDRYGHSIEVVMISLKPQESEEVTEKDVNAASHAMEAAVQKSIRTVDVCIKYGRMQFLALMLDAGTENVDAIMQRIFLDYYKMCENRKVEPSYQLN